MDEVRSVTLMTSWLVIVTLPGAFLIKIQLGVFFSVESTKNLRQSTRMVAGY